MNRIPELRRHKKPAVVHRLGTCAPKCGQHALCQFGDSCIADCAANRRVNRRHNANDSYSLAPKVLCLRPKQLDAVPHSHVRVVGNPVRDHRDMTSQRLAEDIRTPDPRCREIPRMVGEAQI